MRTRRFIKDCLTEKDGVSFCPSRAAMLLGVLVFIGLSIYTTSRGGNFDPQNWGIGFGSVLGGGGAGIWAKGKAE